MISRALIVVVAVVLAACGKNEDVAGYNKLASHVESNRVGGGSDQWIEMVNGIGDAERVGLIFGYVSDYDACLEAISGMQHANPGREYRCVPAN